MARDLKLTAVLVDKVSAGLNKAATDWKKAVEEPAKAMAKASTDAAAKIEKETRVRQKREEDEHRAHLNAKLKEQEKYFKYQLNLVKQSSALQERNEAQRARESMRASQRSLNEVTDAASAAAKINRQAMLAEAALVTDRFDRRANIERVRYAEALRLLKGNDAAIEAETRKHNAIISRLNMDKANFPSTPFQKLLGHLETVTSRMGIQLPQAINTANSTMTSAVGTSAKLALGFAAAGVAAVGFGAGLVASYKEAREGIDVNKKLDLVLRSTGRGAEFTTEELSRLADKYQETTDYSDEAVKSAEVILLRYDAIGKDVFPKALKAAADLGAETGDLAGAAFNLGNALQMPEDGARKLNAMGIKLTDTEKEMLEQFQVTGETIKAQEFILEKVAKAYGGAAEEMSHETTKLKNSFGELLEQMGGPLVGGVELVSKAMRQFFTTMKSADGKEYEAVYEDTAEGYMLVAKEVKKANDELKANNDLRFDAMAQRNNTVQAPKKKTDQQIEAEKEASKKREELRKKEIDEAIEAANYRDEVARNTEKRERNAKLKAIAWEKETSDAKTAEDFRAMEAKAKAKEKSRKKEADSAKVAAQEKVKSSMAGAAGNPLEQLRIQQEQELLAVEGNEAAITAIKRRHEIERRSMIMETSRMTVGGIAGNLRNIAGQYKSFSGVAKKAAQVQNAMDTYAGATAAYKQAMGLPPPFGLIMAPIAAAAAVAGGLANASRINSQGFEKGGWTGNGGRTEVAGVVHGGEMVWSQSDVRRAGGRQAAENIRQGQSTTQVHAPISIVIQGNADERTAKMIGQTLEQELKTHAWRNEQIKYRGITA